jgi:hypothetical protein
LNGCKQNADIGQHIARAWNQRCGRQQDLKERLIDSSDNGLAKDRVDDLLVGDRRAISSVMTTWAMVLLTSVLSALKSSSRTGFVSASPTSLPTTAEPEMITCCPNPSWNIEGNMPSKIPIDLASASPVTIGAGPASFFGR